MQIAGLSPANTRSAARRRCASVPYAMTVEMAPMLASTTMRAETVHERAISSMTNTVSRKLRPWPPYSSGIVIPMKRSALSASTTSQGYSRDWSISAPRLRSSPFERAAALSFKANCWDENSIASLLLLATTHGIESGVRTHACHVGEPVRQAEEGRDRGDVPDVFLRESVRLQRDEVALGDLLSLVGDPNGEIQHRLLAVADVGLAVVDGDLISDQRILGTDPQNRPMRHNAILALVEVAGRDHDHLALGFGQIAGLVHQRIVVGEEGAELLRSVREHEEDIRNEARLLLNDQD